MSISYELANEGFEKTSTIDNTEGTRLRLACVKTIGNAYAGTHEQALIFYGSMDDLSEPGAVAQAASEYIAQNNLSRFGISDISSPLPISAAEEEQMDKTDKKDSKEKIYKIRVIIRSTSV